MGQRNLRLEWTLRILHAIYRVLRAIYIHANTVIDRAGNHHSFLLSAGISFNVFLAVLPTLLTIVFVVDMFTDATSVALAFRELIERTLPENKASADMLHALTLEIEQVFNKSSSFGLVGIPSLIWISSALFGAIRTGLNRVYNVAETGLFLKYKLRDFGMLAILLLLLLVSNFANTAYALVESAGRQIAPEMFQDGMAQFISYGAQFLVTALFFYLMYLIIPSRRQPAFVINVSTLICTLLWVAARFLFTWYTSNFASYGRIYGTYAVLVAVALWLYYSSLILLISAEIARYWNECRQEARKKNATVEN